MIMLIRLVVHVQVVTLLEQCVVLMINIITMDNVLIYQLLMNHGLRIASKLLIVI